MRFRPSYMRWTIVVLAAMLPVAAIGFYSFYSAQRSIHRISVQHSAAMAAMAGEAVQQQFRRSMQLGRVVAGFPVFAESVKNRDVPAVRERLRRLIEAIPEVDRVYVMDLEGLLWCDWPIAPESLGQSFAHRDYFTGIRGNWQPYVSEVFQRQAAPRPFVIAVSSAIRDSTGEVVGILVLQHRLDTVTQWLRRVNVGERGAVLVLDHHGWVAGHSGMEQLGVLHKQYGDVEPVRAALRGEGSRKVYTDPLSGREMIATFEPVELAPGRYWVVIAQQDATEAAMPAMELGRQIALAALITALLALTAGVLLARVSERIRVMGAELAERNYQLQQVVMAEREANTALKKAQGQLIEQEKLAGLGQMVAGIAHEINNPLSFVANNIAVLQRDLLAIRDLLTQYRSADDLLREQRPDMMRSIGEQAQRVDLDYTLPNLEELLTRSREGLRRIQQIVRDLRDFARLDENMVQDADLNAGVASTVNIIRGRAKKKGVELEMELGEVSALTCAPSRLNQVVMNLISNAIDASPDGGHVKVRSYETAGVVCVSVADQGPGVPAEIMGRIFDPFFTTKPQGEGTGLGLSISYGIARDHGGTIEVQSDPGKGATFTLKIPLKAQGRSAVHNA